MKSRNHKKAIHILIAILVIIAFIGCKKSTKETNTLSEKDKIELNELRDNLISAILKGDPLAYADQCADDIRLLHPGTPLVSGREDLIKHVAPIPGIQIKKLVLTPVEIYGIGDLAYEVGTQSVLIEPALEGFGTSRKYLHVMRKTEKGWRFVALMSSDN